MNIKSMEVTKTITIQMTQEKKSNREGMSEDTAPVLILVKLKEIIDDLKCTSKNQYFTNWLI